MDKLKQIKVQEAMNKNLVYVHPETKVHEVARLMTEHHVHSLPVVNHNVQVVGIISESDLFLKEKGMPFSAVRMPHLFERWVDPGQLAEIYENAANHTAEDVMTSDVTCVKAGESLDRAAWLMVRKDVRALPVVDDSDCLVGMLSRKDFIRMLAKVE
jgi:CBS domain-containing protein